MRLLTPSERVDLGMSVARSICPEDWAECDAGNGRCSNMAGWNIKNSITSAASVLDLLEERGIIGRVADYDQLKENDEGV